MLGRCLESRRSISAAKVIIQTDPDIPAAWGLFKADGAGWLPRFPDRWTVGPSEVVWGITKWAKRACRPLNAILHLQWFIDPRLVPISRTSLPGKQPSSGSACGIAAIMGIESTDTDVLVVIGWQTHRVACHEKPPRISRPENDCSHRNVSKHSLAIF